MSSHRANYLVRLRIPQLDSFVGAGARQQTSIWRKRHVVNVRSMFGQRPFQFARGHIPQPNGFVTAAARQNSPIGGESNGQNRAVVSLERFWLRIGTVARSWIEDQQQQAT